ncbi:STAS/SEC14 domain-containing protein [Mycobacterium intracellulare]|uniref:STAS/SEC14 domain-containing protein n=1 Tax=Mycobacterium intracellulare TaxID=1767 RepID=UPI001CD9F635|nr:STAS/SEC14 domain-containing protein [Mycobacterium intracellulare]
MGVLVLKELASVPAGIQALEAVGTVTAEDYDRVFAPLVDRARRTKGRMRLLYQFGPGFERITAGALWADTRLGVGYVAVLDGCAVVSDIEWIRAPARGIGAWMPCPTRVYGNDERDDAVAWLASLPRGAGVSKRDTAKAFIGGTLAAVGSLAGLVISAGTKSGRGTR